MRIKPLELRVKAIMEGLWKGIHRSPWHGFSAEFSEYRDYSPGDDPRRIDWKVLAKSDRAYVKRFEDETNLRAHLLVDRSQSMGFGSGEITKADYAGTLAATLAYFLVGQGDAVGLFTFSEGLDEVLPPKSRISHLQRIFQELDQEPGGGTDLDGPLAEIAAMIHRRGLVVLISDLLAPTEMLEDRLRDIMVRGHQCVVFQILDPEEIEFGYQDAIWFTDLESGERKFIDPEQAREAYQVRIEAHSAALRNCCETNGAQFFRLSTADPIDLALFEYLAGGA